MYNDDKYQFTSVFIMTSMDLKAVKSSSIYLILRGGVIDISLPKTL